PVVFVVANFFAVTTNRQQSMELLDVDESGFQFVHTVGQGALEVDHPRADLNARAQLRIIKGFDYVIVRSRFETLDDVFLGGTGGQQENVGAVQPRVLTGPLAYLHSV